MKSKLALALLGATFSFYQPQYARAATLNGTPTSIDFGSVAVGGTSIPVTVTANGIPDPNFPILVAWDFQIIDPSEFGVSLGLSPPNNCKAFASVCNMVVTFSPTSLGLKTANLLFSFQEDNFAGESVVIDPVTVPLIGLGVEATSTTPLPAALPLFATGLGALGLLARRRKPKATALPV
jgi:hypothetical protein